MSRHNSHRQSGFTLIETVAAIVVLSIGLVGMAVLMSNMMTGGARSRYMNEAAMLASEKLEDLVARATRKPPPRTPINRAKTPAPSRQPFSPA
jgi:prepilin-type N-terminal cleavage/methylation domain-containing protein